MPKTTEKLASQQESPDDQAGTGRNSLGFKIWHVFHGWQRQLEQTLEPLHLTHLQFVLIVATSHITARAAPPTQGQLAEFTGFDRMMISKVLVLLEKKGLIERRAHPRISRANEVVLTPTGLATLQKAMPLWKRANDVYFGRLGSDQQGHFSTMLDTLMRGLKRR